ncbi:hypothetical protein BST61_g7995 [Cercospora zeina]
MVAKKDIKPFQVVFKVQGNNHAHKTRPPRPFVPRKAHSKSRGGCQACKKRKIKCDETLPSCSRCSTLECRCIYPSSTSSRADSATYDTPPEGNTPQLSSEMHSMAVALAQTDLQSLLCPTLGSRPPTAYRGDFRTLQHFQSVGLSVPNAHGYGNFLRTPEACWLFNKLIGRSHALGKWFTASPKEFGHSEAWAERYPMGRSGRDNLPVDYVYLLYAGGQYRRCR